MKGTPVPFESRQYLLTTILDQIKTKGKITYRELMQALLYHQAEGFYTRHLNIGPGRNDHFSTRPTEFSPNYGAAFARKLARFSWLFGLDQIPFDLVALGDGTGVFFHDILAELQNIPEVFNRLRPSSLELVGRFARTQRSRLEKFGVHIIRASVAEIPLKKINGIVFANELFDQFAMNMVINRNGTLREKYIILNRRGDLSEAEGPLSSPEIKRYFNILGKLPGQNRSCPVNLDAMRTLENLSRCMENGLVFIIDYNTKRRGLHPATHSRFGRDLRLAPENICQALGRDITTDVDFCALQRLAKHFGFRVLFQTSDYDFLYDTAPAALLTALGYPIEVLALQTMKSRAFPVEDGICI